MTQTSSPASFTIDEKVTNTRGAWVILRKDVNAGTLHCGIYYAEAWAPNFTDGLEFTTLTPNVHRDRVERGMRQWLKGR